MHRFIFPWILATGVVLGYLPSPCPAQVDEDNSATALKKQSADPSLTSNLAEKPQVSLTSNEEESTVTASLAIELANDFIFGVKLQSPIENGQEEVELANLDGLAGSTTATLSIERMIWKNPDRPGALIGVCREYNLTAVNEVITSGNTVPDCSAGSIPKEATYCSLETEPPPIPSETSDARVRGFNTACFRAANEICKAYNEQADGKIFLFPADELEVDDSGTLSVMYGQSHPGFLGVCSPKTIADMSRDDEVDAEDGDSWIDRWTKRVDELASEICKNDSVTAVPDKWISMSSGCSLTELGKRGKTWRQKGQKALGLHRPVLLSLSASTSTKAFSFLDEDSLEKQEETKEGFAVAASVGVLSLGGTYYGASYRRERSYKASSSTEICRPIEDTDALRCDDGVLGGPTRRDRDLVQLEARKYLGDHLGGTLRLTRDFEEEVWGYQLLLYFLQHKDKGLNGGLDFGYRDDNDDFTVRVFIGTSFALLGGG